MCWGCPNTCERMPQQARAQNENKQEERVLYRGGGCVQAKLTAILNCIQGYFYTKVLSIITIWAYLIYELSVQFG